MTGKRGTVRSRDASVISLYHSPPRHCRACPGNPWNRGSSPRVTVVVIWWHCALDREQEARGSFDGGLDEAADRRAEIERLQDHFHRHLVREVGAADAPEAGAELVIGFLGERLVRIALEEHVLEGDVGVLGLHIGAALPQLPQDRCPARPLAIALVEE